MSTHNNTHTWKFWAAGTAATIIAGATGYLLLSSDQESKTSTTKASEETVASTVGRSTILDSVRRALAGLVGSGVSAGSNGGAPFVILPIKGLVVGTPLVSSEMNPHTDKGRIAKLDRSALKDWNKLQAGSHVTLPSLDGQDLSGEVHLRMDDNGWARIGGTLANGQGTFNLNTNFDEVGGSILMPETGRAYEIRTDASGDVLVVERQLSSLVCWPLSVPEAAAASTSSSTAISAGGQVPVINTRPGAKGLIYIDFDGEIVTDPSWNGGRTINAAASNLNADQIREVVARVAEDYAPFDITISTLKADYDAMPANRRTRVIVTPTSTAAPGAGGVAMVGSWSQAGKWLSSTVPAWVFNSSVKAVAEGISHEAGHTFGLNHQGTSFSSYYSGHGGDTSVPTSWAPIMGNSYSRSLTQWAKGEYANANNTEDALAIISAQTNGVGYRTDVLTGQSLNFSGNTFQLSGLLRSASAPDTYQFKTAGGLVSASVTPSAGSFTDADIQLELRDSSGATLAVSNPVDALGASISKDGLPAGTYQLIVSAAGTGPRPAGGYTVGYSSYGSLGSYTLSGTVVSPVVVPIFSSPASVNGLVGQPFSYHIAVDSPMSAPEGTLPPGLSFDAPTNTLSGTPTSAGIWSLTLRATNSNGTTSRTLTIRIDDPVISLASVLGNVSNLTSSPEQSPWVGVSVTKSDGQTGLAAVSGRLADGGSSSLQFTAPGQSILSFWWKVSSEAGHDFLTCKVNGNVAVDTDSATRLIESGESGWVHHRIKLSGYGNQQVEIAYSKDATLSNGLDRAWVYGIEVGKPPVFKSNPPLPKTLVLKSTDTSFTLTQIADGATGYQWKKDGVTLVDETVGTHVISGATTSQLKVSGVVGADSGTYWVEALNASGKVISRKAEVVIAGPPEITSQPVAPGGVKVGDNLMLSVGVSGPQPIWCLWVKNGSGIQWSPSTVYQVKAAKANSAGTYSVYVVNRYGWVQSAPIQVNVDTAASAPVAK